MQFDVLGKYLIIFGIVLIIMGALLTWGPKLPFIGRLPGDIYIERKHFSFYFPLVTCIILSIILTIILNLFGRR